MSLVDEIFVGLVSPDEADYGKQRSFWFYKTGV